MTPAVKSMVHKLFLTIMLFCRPYKNGEPEICKDLATSSLWQRKAEVEFGVASTDFKMTPLTAQERYLQLLVYHGGVAFGSEKYLSLLTGSVIDMWDVYFRRTVRSNKLYLLHYADLSKSKVRNNLNFIIL